MKTIIVDNRFVLFISALDFMLLEKYLAELKVAEKSGNQKDENFYFEKYSRFRDDLKKKYKLIKIDLKA